jgi:hypothetical protein
MVSVSWIPPTARESPERKLDLDPSDIIFKFKY